jgi:signal transduction histidine kinase
MDGVDPGLALTVYRVLQEGLTNVIKHAGPDAAVEVLLRIDESSLNLEIADTGRGPAPDGARPGHGLMGMRERVAVLNGRLRAGPRPGGGYRLCASIPLEPTHGPARPPAGYDTIP